MMLMEIRINNTIIDCVTNVFMNPTYLVICTKTCTYKIPNDLINTLNITPIEVITKDYKIKL